MFICRACAARTTTNNLLRRTPTTHPSKIRAPTASPALARRAFASSPSPTRPPAEQDDWGELEAAAAKTVEPHQDRQATRKKSVDKLRWATKKELSLTTDPYHIAERVTKMLKDGDFEKALMFTREASRNRQVVVAWNHLIENEFSQDKLHAAIKLFNEMKKRAQLPNAQTYTIIFRGCAQSTHPKQAINEALKIYNAMLASSRLKPNTIHLNAVLEVCARAQDLESMFVALRSAGGMRAPNNLTYTTILNALRYQPSNYANPAKDPRDEAVPVSKSIETTIARARLIWDEVISRWRKGHIIMDEELMCAMGRVLLLGGAKTTDSVLAVVGDVLGITKLLDGRPALIKPEAHKPGKAEPAARPEASDGTGALEDLAASGNWDKPEEADEYSSSMKPKQPEYAPQDQQERDQQQRQLQQQQQQQRQHAQGEEASSAMVNIAGNNTLSLVLRALAQDRRTKLAGAYWDLLIQTRGVVPDRRNYRDYIDCLATGSASGRAARVLQSMPASVPDANLYRRGLLMCKFDAFNEHAFDNALSIFDAMTKKLRVPDPRCISVFLEVAVTSFRRFKDAKKYPTQKDQDRAYGRQMVAALDRTFEQLRRVTNDETYSLEAAPPVQQDEILKAARKYVGLCDRLISQALIPKTDSEFKVILLRRRTMDAFVNRWQDRSARYGSRTPPPAWQGARSPDDAEDMHVRDSVFRVSRSSPGN